MNKVRLGIVGVGAMGSSHLNNIRSGKLTNVKLAALCDLLPEKEALCSGKGFLEQYKKDVAEGKIDANLGNFLDESSLVCDDAAFFTDYKELIKSGLVDAIVIATPHYAHTYIAEEALDAGIHVLTEKPISVHKKDCLRIIEAHKRNPELKWEAMFNQRTIPIHIKVKELLDNQMLGEIRRFSWTITDWFRSQAYYDSGTWRATWKGEGGGVLLNQCPHNLDLLCYFLGMPARVRSFCSFGKFHRIEVEDQVTAYLELPNGANGLFITTTGEFPGTNRLEIAGDKGKLVMEGGKLTLTKTDVPVQEFSDTTEKPWSHPNRETLEVGVPAAPVINQHPQVLQNFIDSILFDEKLIAPGEEGLMSVELANGILMSTLKDKTVEFPLDADEYAELLARLIAKSENK
ncbi:MAG: Gfo/Idh/MocA family oxidoreductase [Abditibacteriota bacterium]|nr:Gfo/Idh/MocA family oxidoreductase [Abditibacteriota bacterium]